ncbi:hypothetical protein [Salipaludibacillus daqingensis]|uniref:hypothetical protein n=1 Tax=Salipaludibacillus daqingensis TaxID=3041001 RepID=UPI0024759050|nr:hypothetical protein [Salipaludibacillus daqingensis]
MSEYHNDEQNILNKLRDMPKKKLSDESKTKLLTSIKKEPSINNKRRFSHHLSFVASLLLFPAVIFIMWELLSGTDEQISHQALGINIDFTPAEEHTETVSGLNNPDPIDIVPQEQTGYYATESRSSEDVENKIKQLLNEKHQIKAYELNGIIRQDDFSFASFHYVDNNDHLFIGTAAFHNREDRLLIDQIKSNQVTNSVLRDLEDGHSPAATLYIEDMYYFLGIAYSFDNNIDKIVVENNERTFDYDIDGHVVMTVISQTNQELVEANAENLPGYNQFDMEYLDTNFCLDDGQCYQRYFMDFAYRSFPD